MWRKAAARTSWRSSNEFESQRPGQVGNELRILLRRRAAKAVIEMQNGEGDPQLGAQAMEQPQQSHRIGAAGNRDTDTIPGGEQAGIAQALQDASFDGC